MVPLASAGIASCLAKAMFAQMINSRMSELGMNPDAPFVQASVYDEDFFLAKTKGAVNGVVIPKEALHLLMHIYRYP